MVRAELWSHAARRRCRDGELAFRLIGADPVAVPEAEASEPVVGALARLLQACRGSGTLVMLENPAQAFGTERIPLTEGVRLFALHSDEDVACWDAILSLGQPIYGVRGMVAMEVMTAHPAGIVSALAYGLFTCDEGLSLTGLHEDRAGVAYASDRETTATVVIRGGFESVELHGAAGEQVRYVDRGGEAYVRLVITDRDGNRCWTQPRFVVPAHGGKHGQP